MFVLVIKIWIFFVPLTLVKAHNVDEGPKKHQHAHTVGLEIVKGQWWWLWLPLHLPSVTVCLTKDVCIPTTPTPYPFLQLTHPIGLLTFLKDDEWKDQKVRIDICCFYNSRWTHQAWACKVPSTCHWMACMRGWCQDSYVWLTIIIHSLVLICYCLLV